MSKQFWAVVAVIVIIFVGIFALNGNKKSDTNSKNSSSGGGTQHVQGKGTTGVTLVEFGDYQCPYCGQYFPTVKQVVAKYGDQIKFQFKNFPLTSIHQNAFAAARAAEAAGLQGKFWEMNEVLYSSQSSWSEQTDPTPIFAQYAQQLGLNVDQFKKDSSSSKVNDLINADMAEGTKLKVTGTPAFFINGEKIDVSNSVESFSKAIDAAIAKQAKKSTSSTQQ